MFYNIAMDYNFENVFQNFSDTTCCEFTNYSCSAKVGEINDTLPAHLRFNENTLTIVLIYSALFVVAAIGNLTVFVSLFRSRHRKSRISLMIRHLAVADLFVTFIMIPIETVKMKGFLWLVITFALIHNVRLQMSEKAFQSGLKLIKDVCMRKNKVTNEQVTQLHEGIFPDERNLQCYTDCSLRMSKIIKGDVFKIDEVADVIKTIPTPRQEGSLKAVETLRTLVLKSDKCEYAYQIYQQLFSYSPPVGWRLTVQWLAGNLACKAFLFLRAFGLYLSSNILVCVSLDRYFAILHPLRVNDARQRGKYMLACAWGISLAYSVPQSMIFHVAAHPQYPTFYQCVSFGFFPTEGMEIAYNVFGLVAMYFIPLLVIIVAYTAIMWEITSKSKESKIENLQKPNGKMTLRRSDIRNIARARSRTLKMTITIVVVFVWCWTPYVVMTLWYMFDRTSAEKLPNWLQDALFMMAVSNSCMNPMVYGSYAMNFRKECSKCLCCIQNNEEPGLTRKSTDAETMLAAAGQPGLARRVIKCVLGYKKVGSGTTKSTCTPMNHHVVGNRSPKINFEKSPSFLPPEKCNPNIPRPLSIGYISTLTNHSENGGYVTTCHSDPFPCTRNPSDKHLNRSLRYLKDQTTLESAI